MASCTIWGGKLKVLKAKIMKNRLTLLAIAMVIVLVYSVLPLFIGTTGEWTEFSAQEYRETHLPDVEGEKYLIYGVLTNPADFFGGVENIPVGASYVILSNTTKISNGAWDNPIPGIEDVSYGQVVNVYYITGQGIQKIELRSGA